ncbi:MAG: hypothetical protein WD044_16285 [Dongiaceae bacterium]
MAKKNKKQASNGPVLFNIVYQDGTLSSNRKVPGEIVGGLDGDTPARSFIEAQDREIAERSGRPRGPIKTIARSPSQ